MTTRYERLHPLYEAYIAEEGDVVMFRHAPFPVNQRRQYVVKNVSWWMGKVQKVRIEISDQRDVFTYDLDAAEFERLGPVKVGRLRWRKRT